jgi:cell division protein FtsB
MTGIDLAADVRPDAPAAIGRGRRASGRVRLPSSRGGLTWLIVLVVVGGLVAVQFGRQVYANWEIGQQAAELEAQIAAVEAENARLQDELDYVESEAFIGAEARRLANLGASGEEVLIIPEGAEAPLPDELAASEQPKPLLQQWWELFFGR